MWRQAPGDPHPAGRWSPVGQVGRRLCHRCHPGKEAEPQPPPVPLRPLEQGHRVVNRAVRRSVPSAPRDHRRTQSCHWAEASSGSLCLPGTPLPWPCVPGVGGQRSRGGGPLSSRASLMSQPQGSCQSEARPWPLCSGATYGRCPSTWAASWGGWERPAGVCIPV